MSRIIKTNRRVMGAPAPYAFAPYYPGQGGVTIARTMTDAITMYDQLQPRIGMKMNTGVYWRWQGPGVGGYPGQALDQSAQMANQLAFMNTWSPGALARGWHVNILWRSLEGDTKGDYKFQVVRDLLDFCRSRGMQLIIGVQTAWYGNLGNSYQLLPKYIVDDTTNYGVEFFRAPANGRTAKTWETKTNGTANALADMFAAFMTEFGRDLNFEGMAGAETSLQVDGTYSSAEQLTAVKHLMTVMRAAGPNCLIWIGANDGFNDAGFVDLFTHGEAKYCAFGGPDDVTKDITQANRVYHGFNEAGVRVTRDFSNVLAWASANDWQSFDLDGAGNPRYPMQTLWDGQINGYNPSSPGSGPNFFLPSMKPRYYSWYCNEANGNATNQWSSAERSFLQARAPTFPNYTAPTSYPAIIQ